MTTLTLDEATKLVPAIGATGPSEKASDYYQFISTRDILERVQQDGWLITGATAQSRSPYAQHRITLVHKNDLNKIQANNLVQSTKDEGIARIELFNSHNLTKRLLLGMGYFRFICSNGLMVASGPAETIRLKHRFSDDRLSEIMEQVSNMSNKFPVINQTIEHFKAREMTEDEQISFVEYAIKGRFNYRPAIPKRFQEIKQAAEKLLYVRREEDNGSSVWQVFNRVQENLIQGVDGFSRPIRGYSDSVRVNQLLWKGAETSLKFDKQLLHNQLMSLIAKDGKKGKITV